MTSTSTTITDVFGEVMTMDELRLADIAEGEGRISPWKQSVTALNWDNVTRGTLAGK